MYNFFTIFSWCTIWNESISVFILINNINLDFRKKSSMFYLLIELTKVLFTHPWNQKLNSLFLPLKLLYLKLYNYFLSSDIQRMKVILGLLLQNSYFIVCLKLFLIFDFEWHPFCPDCIATTKWMRR